MEENWVWRGGWAEMKVERQIEISLQVDDISNLILCINYINTLFS